VGPTSGTAEQLDEVHLRLAPQPLSVARARSAVRGLLERGERGDLAETAVLLVSELVTNALLHAGTHIDLVARLGSDGVRVEVGDGSLHLPSRRRYAATAGTGRGLMMLDSMAADWGVRRRRNGKVVWFELVGGEHGSSAAMRRNGDERPSAASGAAPGRARGAVRVELRNLPLLLHVAWQEHAEALLREYLLAGLDDDTDRSIQVHAEATDAIAVLEEHVPRSSVAMDPEQLMRDAVEPNVSAARVDVPVPRASLTHFETLDRAIEAALDLAEAGLVLSPATQPEVQAFRQWLCGQVREQAAGAAPRPWAVPDEGRLAEVQARSGVLPADLGTGRALVVADQSNTIVAVTVETALLLGYAGPADLVGMRIVAIIPERYRQAHVAGFTMYLLVGRRPLLDHVVRVPALRKDGSEVTIGLLVREHQGEQGEPLLLAELQPVG
jgi:PAS domain S-box-containing protein